MDVVESLSFSLCFLFFYKLYTRRNIYDTYRNNTINLLIVDAEISLFCNHVIVVSGNKHFTYIFLIDIFSIYLFFLLEIIDFFFFM